MTADLPTPSGAESTKDPASTVAVTNAARMTTGLRFDNGGQPLRLTGVNMCGISAAPARGGEQAEIWTRMSLTSADALFHHIVPSLADAIEGLARAQGHAISLSSHAWTLLVIRPDDTAELWLDTAAVVTETCLRQAEVKAGTVLFERDIADITGVWFPRVDIGAEDRIVCLFREGWRFGLMFDFGADGALNVARARRDLGTLLRWLRYAKLYTVVAHRETLPALVGAGWFPFLELFSGEFETLASQLENGFELDTAEADLVGRFDAARLDRMFARWMARPHLKAREPILRSGMDAFRQGNAVATLKILLTEVEGVLSEACFAATGERTHRIPKLLDFVQTAAATRAGGQDTLFFPVEFAGYLKDHTFAGFTPGAARSASRNAVGHGALPADQYTLVRALQALLTLDQLAFYT